MASCQKTDLILNNVTPSELYIAEYKQLPSTETITPPVFLSKNI